MRALASSRARVAALLRSVGGGERALVEDYELAVLPSAAALATEHRAAEARGSLLAMAPGRSGLRFAREEVMGIGKLFSRAYRDCRYVIDGLVWIELRALPTRLPD